MPIDPALAALALGGYGAQGQPSQSQNIPLGIYNAYQQGEREDESQRRAANMMMMATGIGILGTPAGAGGSVMSSVGAGLKSGLNEYQQIQALDATREAKRAQQQYNLLKEQELAQYHDQMIRSQNQRAQEANDTRLDQARMRQETSAANREARQENMRAQLESQESRAQEHNDMMRAIAADRRATAAAGRAAHVSYQKGTDGTLIGIDNETHKSWYVSDPGNPDQPFKAHVGGKSATTADDVLNAAGLGADSPPAAAPAAAAPGGGVQVGRFKVFKD